MEQEYPKVSVPDGYTYRIEVLIQKGNQVTDRKLVMGGSAMDLDALKNELFDRITDIYTTFKKENE